MCDDDYLPSFGEPFLCELCLSRVLSFVGSACVRCAAPVPSSQVLENECPRCEGESFRFERAVALGIYRDDLRLALLKMKHVSFGPLAVAMGGVLANQVTKRWPERSFDLIVPVPMYWSRRLLRGTNNVELLADGMTEKLQVPSEKRVLRLRRKTKRQSTLSPAMRFKNMRGAFGVSSQYVIKGAHILLVDDILTTAATATDAARALLEAGADKVDVAVVGRGVGLE